MTKKLIISFEYKCCDCGTNCGVNHCVDYFGNIYDLCNECLETRDETEKSEHLEKFQKIALEAFIDVLCNGKIHAIDAVNKEVQGELLEMSYLDISYWYGNGELITTSDRCSTTWGLDNINGNSMFVILEDDVADLE